MKQIEGELDTQPEGARKVELKRLYRSVSAWANKRFDDVVAIGAIIRGGTTHFEYVSEGTALGLARVTLDTGVPVIFGVHTTEDETQALDRAGGVHGNKGRDAALTAIEMAVLDRKLAGDGITTKRA